MSQLGKDGLPLDGRGDLLRKHAVIRFKRAAAFPRFSMAEGERWSFVVYGKNERLLEDIRSADRFEFAGGMGLSADVEIVYEGPSGRELAVAAGWIAAWHVDARHAGTKQGAGRTEPAKLT